MFIHTLFDLFAILAAVFFNYYFRKQFQLSRPASLPLIHQYTYPLVLIIGMVVGSIVFGTLNIQLSKMDGFGKSLIGGIAGAVFFAEIFKKISGIKGSTGFYYIPGLCVLIIIGRIGCYLAGLPDYTYGIATDLPWGVDFGDHIKRHPVQLYESLSMLIFLLLLLFTYKKQQTFWIKQGFYLFILCYAGSRFIWEFLKPYPSVIGSLNIFHLLALVMIIYAVFMLIFTSKKEIQHA